MQDRVSASRTASIAAAARSSKPPITSPIGRVLDAGRAQIEARDLATGIEQATGPFRADAAGTAGDEDAHVCRGHRIASCVTASKTCSRAGSKESVKRSPSGATVGIDQPRDQRIAAAILIGGRRCGACPTRFSWGRST
jgi:hypothetical protein